MIDFTRFIAEDCGLAELPDDLRRELAQRAYADLALAVGMRIAEQLTVEQYEEFEELIDNRDAEGATTWLRARFPNIDELVNEELARLRTRLVRARPRLLAAVQRVDAA